MCNMFSAHSSSKTVKTFYNAKFEVTDFGACCAIFPFLNFVNPDTVLMSPEEYTGEHWHSQKKGSLNGEYGGIKVLLDAESFDFSYTGKHELGFQIAFSDQCDTPSVRHDGYAVSPGNLKKYSLLSLTKK